MIINNKSQEEGGIDVQKIELENKIGEINERIETIRQEKNRKGIGRGRKKQLEGELNKLTANLEELEAENVVRNENKKRKNKLGEKVKTEKLKEKTVITDNSGKSKINKESAWWKERRDIIKLKPDDIMEESEIKQEKIVQAEQEDNNIEQLKKEESDLVEKIQHLPKSHPKEPLSGEKEEIIKKLKKNRERQEEIESAGEKAEDVEMGAKKELGEQIIEEEIKKPGEIYQKDNSNPLNLKNMPEKKREMSSEDYEKELEKNSIDVYSKVNKESELREEQEKATDSYNSEFKTREKASKKERDRLEKLRKEEYAEKEKRAGKLKEKEEFGESYKRQFGEEKDKEDSAKKDSATADLKERPEPKKESEEQNITDNLRDSEAWQKKKIDELEKENVKLKENLEKTELFMKNAKNALREKINELPEKDAGKWEKIKKFLTNPKVKFAIGVGLLGTATVATSGGSLVGAWLGVSYGWGIPALGGTSNLIAGALGGAGIASGIYSAKLKEGFRQNMKDILNIMKNEKESAVGETSAEVKIKEPQIIQERTRKDDDKIDVIEGSGSAKELTPEEISEMRQTAEDNKIDIISPSVEVKKDKKMYKLTDEEYEEVKLFLGKGGEGKWLAFFTLYMKIYNDFKNSLPEDYFNDIKKFQISKSIENNTAKITLFIEEKGEKRKKITIDMGFNDQDKSINILDVLKEDIEEFPQMAEAEEKEEIKKDKNKTEDRFDKKATEVKTFVGQLKEGKKTGKEIFEYLENLRHHFLYPDRTNFDSKIRPELDKLSKKEKTDMIDLTVEYCMSREKEEFLGTPFRYSLEELIYGKDFAKEDYVEKGKKENVEWLYGNKS